MQQERRARKQAFETWEMVTGYPLPECLVEQDSNPYKFTFLLHPIQQIDDTPPGHRDGQGTTAR
ncbi:hypothetical protein G3N57_08475 [Paraburkholderia sp. Se-20369]|nr:hypothetical protein [Paraburkholderia sp. Se-20369]